MVKAVGGCDVQYDLVSLFEAVACCIPWRQVQHVDPYFPLVRLLRRFEPFGDLLGLGDLAHALDLTIDHQPRCHGHAERGNFIDALEGVLLVLIAVANISQIDIVFFIPSVVFLIAGFLFLMYVRSVILKCKEL